jgi:hypothetical protein
MPEQRPQIPPVPGQSGPGWDVAVSDRVNRLLNGKVNVSAVLTVTLRDGEVTTDLVDERIGYFSVVILTPVTQDAADIGAVGLWYETAAGMATLHHVSDASITMTFKYAVLG